MLDLARSRPRWGLWLAAVAGGLLALLVTSATASAHDRPHTDWWEEGVRDCRSAPQADYSEHEVEFFHWTCIEADGDYWAFHQRGGRRPWNKWYRLQQRGVPPNGNVVEEREAEEDEAAGDPDGTLVGHDGDCGPTATGTQSSGDGGMTEEQYNDSLDQSATSYQALRGTTYDPYGGRTTTTSDPYAR